jgi:hypothetical protein
MSVMNLVKKNQVSTYLQGKSIAYQTGWRACEQGNPHRQVSDNLHAQALFDQGYGECFANNECLRASA